MDDSSSLPLTSELSIRMSVGSIKRKKPLEEPEFGNQHISMRNAGAKFLLRSSEKKTNQFDSVDKVKPRVPPLTFDYLVAPSDSPNPLT